MRRTARTASAVAALLAAAVLLRPGAAAAGTTAEKTGACEITVTLRIEIFGDAGTAVTVHEPDAGDIEIPGAATEALARRWKKDIESTWNGLTEEQAREVMKAAGQSQLPRRGRYDQELARFRRDTDQPDAALVDCCRIRFVARVRVRRGGPEDGTPGWHQVMAVASHYEVDAPDPPPGAEKYKKKGKKRVWFRSWVRMPEKPGGSGTGAWADDPSYPVAAHEAGHLMRLGDEYTDVKVHGKTVSRPKKGHHHDLMANVWAYPKAGAIRSILKELGAECDCCAAVDEAYQKFAITDRVARDALFACNLEVLRQLAADLADQMRSLGGRAIPFADKWKLWKRLKGRLEEVRKHIEECEKEVAVGVWDSYHLADDSAAWCTYGEGEGREFPGGGLVAPPPGGEEEEPKPPPEGGAPGHPPGERDGGRPAGGVLVPGGPPGEEEKPKRPPEEEVPPAEEEVPPPEEAKPPSVTVFVKASRVGTGEAIGGRRIKLIDPALTDPPLVDPRSPAGSEDWDVAASEDPFQCVTGPDGGCEVDGVPVAPGSAPESGRVEAEVRRDDTKSFVVPAPLAHRAGAPAAEPAARHAFRIGNRGYLRLDFTSSALGSLAMGRIRLDLPDGWTENLCRDKEPAMPVEQALRFRAAPARPLPRAEIRLDTAGVPR